MYEKNLSSELVAVVDNYEIYRCEAKMYDEYKDKFVGRKKVYYDVCFSDGGDIIESHKTLREAKKFANSL
jgi:hypothetical protein